MLLYATAKSGYVGFYDPTSSANGDLYLVASSLAPVAVAYDPLRKVCDRLRPLVSYVADWTNLGVDRAELSYEI